MTNCKNTLTKLSLSWEVVIDVKKNRRSDPLGPSSTMFYPGHTLKYTRKTKTFWCSCRKWKMLTTFLLYDGVEEKHAKHVEEAKEVEK
jgi:hypothetical protein